MQKKIKIAVVDDDESMYDILRELYSDSSTVEIKYGYTDSLKFIHAAPVLDFDMCFLDISMPGLDGLSLAQLLKNKSFIFITGSEDKLKAALSLNPIDVVTKPFNKERLDSAIEKAFKLIGEKIDHALFSVAESKRKVQIHLTDITFADTDETDPRHKLITLKDGKKYTLMSISLEELLSFAPQLVQINKHQLLDIDLISDAEYDVVGLKNIQNLNIPAELTLSRAYKDNLRKRIFFK